MMPLWLSIIFTLSITTSVIIVYLSLAKRKLSLEEIEGHITRYQLVDGNGATIHWPIDASSQLLYQIDYEYHFNNTLYMGSGNILSWESLSKVPRPIRIWVNSENPQESFVKKPISDLRWPRWQS